MMNGWTIAVAAACVVAAPIAAARAGEPAALTTRAVQADPRHASVTIDAEAAGPSARILEERIAERSSRALREASVLPARGPGDTTIHVRIAEVRGEDPGFSIALWLARESEPLGEVETIACELCTETELVDAASAAIGRAVQTLPLDEQPAATNAPSEAPREPVRAVNAGTVEDGAPTTDRRLGVPGKAGIGVVAVGAGALAAGIALAVSTPQPLDGDATRQRDLRPTGYALLATGAAAIITGAVLLVVDRRRATKARTSPTPGPTGAGIGIAVQF